MLWCTALRATAWLLSSILLFESGCASIERDVPRVDHQGALGAVAVLAGAGEPQIKFEGVSTGETAASSAAGTLAACVGSVPGCGSVLCAPLLLVWLGVCSVAGAVGGAVGATMAPSAATVQTAEARWSAADKSVQGMLRAEVLEAAVAHGTRTVAISAESAQTVSRTHDYSGFAEAGAQTVLEVTLTKAGAKGRPLSALDAALLGPFIAAGKAGARGAGADTPLIAYMQAHARLVRVSDNAEVFAEDYLYEGERLKLSEWSADGAKRLVSTFERGYKTLGAYIYDSVFRLYPFPEPRVNARTREADGLGLGAIYPRTTGVLAVDDSIQTFFAWSMADGLQPTLRWEAFPREIDLKLAPEAMSRVRNVRYDLLIAREENLVPAEIVYRRDGLAQSEHRLEAPLSPDTNYFWTVRASFELDGRERVTGWSSTICCPGSGLTAPSQYSFRFKTP